MSSKKILVIDDNTTICTLLETFLGKKGFDVRYTTAGRAGLEQIAREKPDLVLCDFRLPDITGEEVLQQIKTQWPEVHVIIITGYSEVRQAVSLIKQGAYDYVTKPLYPEEILATIHNALNSAPRQGYAEVVPGQAAQNGGSQPTASAAPRRAAHPHMPEHAFIQGDSQRMKKVMELIGVVAPTNISVLIHGETGAGKEVIAREIHLHSLRRDKPFVAVDCGAIPKDLASSELFGHIKGAFTSAISNRMGHFESAHEGTLFLDEIGNLSYDVQVKLLRALQERIIVRVGDSKPIQVDVRVIAATNENLWQRVKEGLFREDLYHRLNEFKIMLPSLRERGDDVLSYAQHFLEQANRDLNKNVSGFSSEYESLMMLYNWPGNLRELRNVIRRSVLFSKGDVVEASSLPEEILSYQPEHELAPVVAEHAQAGDLKSASMNAERQTILNTLIKVNYNKTKAAQALNIDRKTLYNKIKQFNIDLD